MDKETKKIQLKQMRELVEQRSWVKTPWKYTKMGAGLSLIQQQALLMVSEHLQTYIKNFYELKLDKAKDTPKSLFTEHVLKNGIPPFKIWLQDLGVRPENYKEARRAIDEINLQVEHPEFDKDGHETGRTLLTNVFSQFGFDTTGDYYRFEDDEGKMKAVARQNPYIDVKINPDVAMWAFDMQQGYVNHLKLIALYSSKRPTPRIYLLLMRALKKDDETTTLRIPLGELKEYLGIVPYMDPKKKEMVTPYPMFSNFKQKVLDAVRDDLLRMSKEDPPTTDIVFDYELLYPGSRKKGDPEAILFHVTRTILGDAYNVVVNHKPSELMKKPVQQEMFTDEYQQLFERCIDELCSDGRSKDACERFRQIRLESFSKESRTLLMQIPDAYFHQWIESEAVMSFFFAYVSKHFGKGLTFKYRILKSELSRS
jgi:hypothetical protein